MIKKGAQIKVLFVSEAVTLTHVVRPFVLGSALARTGIQVYFAASNCYDSLLPRFPGSRLPLSGSRSPMEFQSILNRGGIIFDQKTLQAFISEDLALIDMVAPDVVVGDMRPSLSVSAAVCNVPHITITNAYWSKFLSTPLFPPPCLAGITRLGLSGIAASLAFGLLRSINRLVIRRVLAKQGAGLNAERRRYGLPAFDSYLEGFTHGDHVVYCDIRELFDFNTLPSNHHFIGPVSWSPTIDLPEWWVSLDDSRPIIYVNLGSSGHSETLQRVLTALADTPYQIAAATAGDALPARIPSNVHISRYLPGDKVLERAHLAITNGGSPACYQALARGVPVIGIAANMDQLIFSSHLERSGAARAMRADFFAGTALVRNCEQLLGSGVDRLRLKRISQTLRLNDCNENFLSIVRSIINTESDHAGHFSM